MSRQLVVLWLIAIAPSARAELVIAGDLIPLGRLITNTERYVANHPLDAQGHYTLGRLLLFGYVQGIGRAALTDFPGSPGRLPRLSDFERLVPGSHHFSPQLETLPGAAGWLPSYERRAGLLNRGIEELEAASKAEPLNPIYRLTLGWGLETRSAALGRANDLEAAIVAYRVAVARGAPAFRSKKLDLVPDVESEAVVALIRALSTKGVAETDPELVALKGRVGHLRGTAITPLVVLLDGTSLARHVDGAARVAFDLAASKRGEKWPWPDETVGILVWDPARSGHIENGTQLFGSVSWWCFWRNGFEALAALDDNGDGELSGRELDGIRLWVDRNHDGVADPGEVHDLAEFGITAIASSATSVSENVPANLHGATHSSGASLAVFDWTPQALESVDASGRSAIAFASK